MSRRGVVLLVLALAGAGGTARLGLWQLDRAEQKLALQHDIDRRAALPPLAAEALAADAGQAQVQEHRRVVLTGRWRPEHTVFLDNRQMNARVGFVVVTPLELADGSAVLVQRGWQPRDFVDRTHVAAPAAAAGTVRVEGRLARDPARLYEFEAAASGPIRQNLQINDFALETGLALRPVSVLQEGPAADDGLQREWPRPAFGVHKHHGYAFQWFALCALIVGLYVWFRIVRPHVRTRRPA